MDAFRRDLGLLLETGLLADSRIVCYEKLDGNDEGKEEKKRVEIPVHRAILIARSKLFASEFNSEKKMKKDEVKIEDFPEKVVRALLYHIYTDTFPKETDDETLLSAYKAVKHLGLRGFMSMTIKTTIIVDRFPLEPWKVDRYDRTFHGKTNYALNSGSFVEPSLCWFTELQMELRGREEKEGEKNASKDKVGKKKKMHMDFTMRPSCSVEDSENILIFDLSISILGVGDEEKKTTIKREGVSRGRAIWKDCLDYDQLLRDGLVQSQVEENACGGTRFSVQPPKLVVLCGATIFAKKSENNILQSDFGRVLHLTNEYADAQLVCFDDENKGGKVTLYAHRCILAARSTFFAGAFTVEMCEASSGVVVVPRELGFSPVTIRAMLSFIYTASIPNEKQEALVALFRAAHFYGIESLMDVCVSSLQITMENCCEMLTLVDAYPYQKLKTKILGFIRNNVDAEKLKELELPLTAGTCCDLLLLADSFNCLQSRFDTLQFIRANAEMVSKTEGWHHLMASPNQTKLKMELPLTVNNCVQMLSLANAHCNEWLKRESLRFLKANKETVKRSDGWRRLTQSASLETLEAGSEGFPENEMLKTLCATYLGELPLTAENCCEMIRIGHDYGNWELESGALDFLRANREAVRATDGWRRLMESPSPSDSVGEEHSSAEGGARQQQLKRFVESKIAAAENSPFSNSSSSANHFSGKVPVSSSSDYDFFNYYSDDDDEEKEEEEEEAKTDVRDEQQNNADENETDQLIDILIDL